MKEVLFCFEEFYSLKNNHFRLRRNKSLAERGPTRNATRFLISIKLNLCVSGILSRISQYSTEGAMNMIDFLIVTVFLLLKFVALHLALGTGSIIAFGYNGAGQCNVPSPNMDFIAVSGRFNHSLGLQDNSSIVAWGDNSQGQIEVPSPNTYEAYLCQGVNSSPCSL